MYKTIISTVMIVILLAGCNFSDPQVDYSDPDQVLAKYFEYLQEEDFEKLVQVYGGDYELSRGYHPNIPPENHVELMRAYVKITGGAIVSIEKIHSKEKVSEEEFVYELSFLIKENEPFLQGQKHKYTVKKINGQFKVMEEPPYQA